MSISLFSPIIPSASANPNEKLGILRIATHFFDFGQKAYQISEVDGPELLLSEIEREKPSWLSIALRVAAFFTVIAPILALIAVAIYREVNQFGLEQKELKKEIPKNQEIALNMLRDSLTLLKDKEEDYSEEVSKICENLVLFDEEKALETASNAKSIKPYLLTLIALSKKDPIRGLSMAQQFFESDKCKESKALHLKPLIMAMIAKNLAPQFPETALDVATMIVNSLTAQEDPDEILSPLSECLTSIAIDNPNDLEKIFQIASPNADLLENIASEFAKAIAKTDPDKAINTANSIKDRFIKDTTVASIAATIAAQDADRAIKLANTIKDPYTKEETLVNIAKTLPFEAGKTLVLSKSIKNKFNKVKIFVEQAIKSQGLNPIKANEAIESAFKKAKSIKDKQVRGEAYCKIAKFAVLDIPVNGLKMTNRVLDLVKRMDTKQDKASENPLGKIAKKIAVYNPEKALEIIGGLSEPKKSLFLAKVSKIMAATNVEKAFEAAEQISDASIIKPKVLASIASFAKDAPDVLKRIIDAAGKLTGDKAKIKFFLKASLKLAN